MGEHKLGYPLPLYYTILGTFLLGCEQWEQLQRGKKKMCLENLTRYSTKNNGIFLFLIVLYFFLDEEEGELTYIQG